MNAFTAATTLRNNLKLPKAMVAIWISQAQEFPDSVASHEEECAAIIEWAEEWIGQDEFDRRAALFCKTKITSWKPETVLLPSMTGGSSYGDFIVLAQCLMAAGLLRARKRAGKVEYCICKPKPTIHVRFNPELSKPPRLPASIQGVKVVLSNVPWVPVQGKASEVAKHFVKGKWLPE